MIDQDEDGVMLEETAAALTAAARQHGCAGLVLVVDSVQTARSVAAEQAPASERGSPRPRLPEANREDERRAGARDLRAFARGVSEPKSEGPR